MKTFDFNFCHPVKGIVRLLNKANPLQNRAIPLDTEQGNCATISVDGLSTGKWKALFEWEFEGRNYCYGETFEI